MRQAISNNLLLVLQDAPKRIFSTNSRSSGQPVNDAKTLFSTLHPLSMVIFATATVLAFVLHRNSRFNFLCYTQREATPTQKSAQKCAVTSRDVLRERLQSAFTLANQLRQIAQYTWCINSCVCVAAWFAWVCAMTTLFRACVKAMLCPWLCHNYTVTQVCVLLSCLLGFTSVPRGTDKMCLITIVSPEF